MGQVDQKDLREKSSNLNHLGEQNTATLRDESLCIPRTFRINKSIHWG